MIPEAVLWAIFLLPLASFVVIALVIRPFFNRYARVAGLLTVAAVAVAFVLSLWALQSTAANGESRYTFHTWLTLGDLELRFGILLNSLTAVMLVVVTGVSLAVQVYSIGYMRGDPGYARYFAFMSLFTASMVGLVLAGNIIQMYVFWELVGLCSYLLIGFWYHKPAAAAAAKKAFIVTRLGDFGLLLAVLYLFFHRGAFAAHGLNALEIPDIYQGVQMGLIGGMALTWLAVGIFAGAVGKSAQFPLHVWLPDAMEGPTPVSALIHAATMVAAGVFLVARFFPLFSPELGGSSEAAAAVAIIGASTALFAATMGLVMNDIKRVMAYSTISQLGYMVAALGVGAYGAATFHLFNHAFFKALLFLTAGSVSHATGTFDMRYMGGLRRAMPLTYVFILVAGLSLAGIFPFSGFWSKDEILSSAWSGSGLAPGSDRGLVSQVVFWLLMASVALTATYTFRMIFMTFHGQYRGGAEAEAKAEGRDAHGGHTSRLAESPLVMLLPMGVLAVAAVVSGYLANPQLDLLGVPKHWFSEFLVPATAEHGEVSPVRFGLAAISTVVALAGIGLATLMYATRLISPEAMARRFRGTYTLLSRKYFMDELYEGVIVRRLFYGRMVALAEWLDVNVVDRVVDMVGWFGRNTGRALAQVQTGQVQGYGAAIAVGVLVILGAYLVLR
ncbi:MAG: NADH-quinone oxidoreductase subunit L [Chloroflexota bacterium]|nr:NADH-quinone oxidoreductase subunit L [Chloroflexota bacterium]